MADNTCKKSRRGGKGVRRTRHGQPTPPKLRAVYPIKDVDGNLITKYTQPQRRGTMFFHLPISLMGGYRPQGGYGPGAGVVIISKGGKHAA